MQTQMTVRLVFDFKGETFRLDTQVTLPLYIDDMDEFLYSLPKHIAQQHQIPIHSYEFEMLEASPIEVTGYDSPIESSLPELPTPVEDFLYAYQTVGVDAYIAKIAQVYELDLVTQPKITQALKAAYQLGKEHKPNETKNSNRPWMMKSFF